MSSFAISRISAAGIRHMRTSSQMARSLMRSIPNNYENAYLPYKRLSFIKETLGVPVFP